MKTLSRPLASAALLMTSALATAAPAAEIAYVELEGALLNRPDPFAWFTGATEPTLLDAVRGIEAAANEASLDGVVIRLIDAPLGTTQVEELGRALQSIRDAGKKVHIFAEGYGANEVLLGAYADERILQLGGGVTVPGIYMEEMFLADMLSWIGVKADLVQVGDYKGAAESTGRSAPSQAWDQNISALLDGLYGSMKSQITSGLGMSGDDFENALSELWLADGTTAIAAGVIDAEVDLSDLEDHLAAAYGEDIEWSDAVSLGDRSVQIDTSNPFAIFQMLGSQPEHTPRGATLAVLHIDGTIIDGESTPASFGGAASTGSRTIRREIQTLIDEDDIRGVVVRIDSPGGSAIASEVMWQGLKRLSEHKPVWVSVGSMAASGGYYTAVGGSKIYMNPSSIVGSIGVVGGKYALGGAYENLKINVVGRARGPRADLFASDSAWSENERRLVRDRMTETYELFTKRVSEGRPDISIAQTAEGRLFEGDRALRLDMVDKIGGLDTALDDMAVELGLTDPAVMHYPGPQSFEDLLEQFTGGLVPFASADQAAPSGVIFSELRALLGADRFEAAVQQLQALTLLRDERVLAVMPRVLIRK